MSTTLTNDDVQVIAQEAVSAAVPVLLPINSFSTQLSSSATVLNDVAKVPVYNTAPDATEYNAATNNYETADSTSVAFVDVTLSKHLKTTFSLTSQQLKKVDPAQMIRAGVNGLIKKVITNAMANITAANFGAAGFTGAASTFDSDDMVDLRTIASAGAWGMDRFAVMSEDYIGSLLKDTSIKSWQNSNTDLALKEAELPKLSGFGVVESTFIPANGENLVGFVTDSSAIALATALPDAEGDDSNLVDIQVITEPQSGFTFVLATHFAPATRSKFYTCEVLNGSAVTGSGRLSRMVSA